jgi:ATP-dependent Clp protease protease subunit
MSKEIFLTDQNTVSLRGPVTRESVGEVMREVTKLSQLGREEDPIFLILNTPGGSVMAGLDLIEYINTLRRPVHSVANYAASMGFHILQSSPRRYVTRFATIMSHRASGGFQGDIPHQISNRLKHVIDLVDKMDEQVISRTNGKYDKKSYMELIRDEYYAVGSNAITDGFADEVVNLKCSEELVNGTVEKVFQVFVFQVKVKFSKCPLMTSPVSIDKEENTDKLLEFLNKARTLEP